MTARQKAGVSLIVSGALSVSLGAVIALTLETPIWVPTVLNILGFLFPAIGLTVQVPTEPK